MCSTTLSLMLVLCSLQYPLYTLMVFYEWKNGILVTFIIIGKSQESDLDPILWPLSKRMPSNWMPNVILVTMFKMKSMCWGSISLNLHTIPCLLLMYCNAYFVTKPNNLANHSLLHIIFWHKLCLFYRALVFIKTCYISCLLDIHKHFIRLLE
jgi:hypothetical protein